jgi:tRNA dimethylallyltransferase
MNKLLIVCGPTATGKTKLATALARQFNGELISADSRQVYRGMDIGTGKDKKDVGDIPLWLIDVVNPDEEFSLNHFVHLAKETITHIRSRQKLPIVVGGTGLYIQSLIGSVDTLDIPPNEALRKELGGESVGILQQKLRALNREALESMNTSDRQNPRRLIRKIEILLSKTVKQDTVLEKEDVCIVGLTAPNEVLYTRIDNRVDTRIQEGMEKEIRSLLLAGYRWDLPSMSGLGYKQWKNYIDAPDGQKSKALAEVIREWKFAEHAYARRQLTWFRKMPGIEWFDITDPQHVSQVTTKVAAWYTHS